MALYSISYSRPGEGPAIWELEAKSDGEARMRFLNLSWVAFTAISVNSIALKGNQPEAAKQETYRRPRKEVAARKRQIDAAGKPKKPTFQEHYEPAAVIARLTEKIGALADEAQALTRAGDHDKADTKRAAAKKLAADRLALTKGIKGK